MTDHGLDELARAHQVWVPKDSPFQRRLRLQQALWRERRGFPVGLHDDHPLGSRLQMPDAERELWNFLTPAVGALAQREYEASRRVRDRRFKKMFGYPRLFNDLLSSQPLCFNLFGPLALDLDLATEVGRRLWPTRVDRVTAVRFEHSPGRWDVRYLDNGTAADVLLEHTLPGRPGVGLIAIETKYHENLRGRPTAMKDRYLDVIAASAAFHSATLPPSFSRPPLQQILLDHLLVLAMKETDAATTALSVLAHPEGNEPCERGASEYAQALDPAGPLTFEARTLTEILAAIRSVTDEAWVTEFHGRYLDSSSVPVARSSATARRRGT